MLLVLLGLAACGGPAAAAAPAAPAATPIPFEFAGRGTVAAVRELVSRSVSPACAELFELAIKPALCADSAAAPPATRGSALCFRLSAAGSKVRVEGSSAVELARGVGAFLREHQNMSFAWLRTGGNQNKFVPPAHPESWAAALLPTPQVQMRRTNISYYQNVVASSYSHAFWAFEDWSHFIDWLALSGINVALAYTGQEEVYRKACENLAPPPQVDYRGSL